MDSFGLWFKTGIEHIVAWDGYDHILFVALLVLAYPHTEWKKLLALITAFTLGHSVSLALSTFNIVHAPRALTELFIAATILAGSLFQLFPGKNQSKQSPLIYSTVTIFGLIHGLGFSFMLSDMLGKSEEVLWPLFCFNLGLEAGQLIVATAVLLFSLFLTLLVKVPYKSYKQTVTCIIALVALFLCVNRSLEYFV